MTSAPPLSTKAKSTSANSIKLIATGLLAIMAVVFALARSFEGTAPWLAPVRAFAEAAMVGAMADWFAVVALFRHPLGIPIPHTAILQKKKDEIGRTLGTFVVENFLTREVFTTRLAPLDLAGIGIGWTRKNAASIGEKICGFVPRILDALNDEDFSRLIHLQLTERIKAIPAAPALGNILSLLTAGGKHEAILDEVLVLADRVVLDNRSYIESQIQTEIPLPDAIGIIPLRPFKEQISAYIADRVVSKVSHLLSETKQNPRHHLRLEFRKWVERFIIDLKESEDYRRKGEEIKNDILANPRLKEYAGATWEKIKESIVNDLSKSDSEMRTRLTGLLCSIASSIEQDLVLKEKLNEGIKSGILDLVDRYAGKGGKIIEETVKAWDAKEMSEKLEMTVGRDLQFIRLNGTIIGGCIGLGLYLVEMVIWK